MQGREETAFLSADKGPSLKITENGELKDKIKI
jgi:hypothetical protein